MAKRTPELEAAAAFADGLIGAADLLIKQAERLKDRARIVRANIRGNKTLGEIDVHDPDRLHAQRMHMYYDTDREAALALDAIGYVAAEEKRRPGAAQSIGSKPRGEF